MALLAAASGSAAASADCAGAKTPHNNDIADPDDEDNRYSALRVPCDGSGDRPAELRHLPPAVPTRRKRHVVVKRGMPSRLPSRLHIDVAAEEGRRIVPVSVPVLPGGIRFRVAAVGKLADNTLIMTSTSTTPTPPVGGLFNDDKPAMEGGLVGGNNHNSCRPRHRPLRCPTPSSPAQSPSS